MNIYYISNNLISAPHSSTVEQIKWFLDAGQDLLITISLPLLGLVTFKKLEYIHVQLSHFFGNGTYIRAESVDI